MLTLLKSFTKITNANESEILEVIPNVPLLNKYLSQRKVYSVRTIREELLNQLNFRFVDVKSNNNFSVYTFLDPRFKNDFLTTI